MFPVHICRSIAQKIPEEKILCLFLGGPVLQSIGCDNGKVLEAACERTDGTIDVERASELDGEEGIFEGSIAALFEE